MILNPFTDKELTIPYAGTRILPQDFGLVGITINDLYEPARYWRIESLYAPAKDRTLGGIRAKLVDNQDFITFLTQMDLEVLIGDAKPGEKCKWSGKTYQAPGDTGFYGMCVDGDDLIDDLFDREMHLRALSPTGIVEENSQIVRRVHVDHNEDVEEYFILLWDGDMATCTSPDPRISTITNRWARIERASTSWRLL